MCRRPDLLLTSTRLLVLEGSTNLLGTVLLLLALLAAALGGLSQAVANHAELGLKLLGGLDGVVDEGEAGGLATTKGVLAAEDDDGVLVGLVHGGELLTDVELAHTGSTGMEDVDNLGGRGRLEDNPQKSAESYHLLAGKETVSHELAGADGNSRVSNLK